MPLMSHRGAAKLAPENTKESIRIADSFNPDYIEIDLNMTSDGVPVLFHGALSRFLRGYRLSQSLKELQSIQDNLLTGEELAHIHHDAPFMFDIKVKDPDDVIKIVDILQKLPRQDFAFTSPHSDTLLKMKSTFPANLCFQAQPYHHGPLAALRLASKNGLDGVSLNKWWLSPFTYLLCRLMRKRLMVYTIDTKLAIWLAARIAPQVFICTNRPDTYRELFPY